MIRHLVRCTAFDFHTDLFPGIRCYSKRVTDRGPALAAPVSRRVVRLVGILLFLLKRKTLISLVVLLDVETHFLETHTSDCCCAYLAIDLVYQFAPGG